MKTKVLVMSLVTLVGGGGILWLLNPFIATLANAESSDNLLSANIASILALSTDSCTADPANTVTIHITPHPTGNTQSNNCQTVGITTNASGGYTLGMHTSDITLQHNPVLTPQQTIPSISATGNNVAVLTSNTWGYAIPKTNNDGNQPNASKLLTTAFITNFDATYSQETNLASSASRYRRAPTTSTLFAQTNTYSQANDEYRLYFAANVPATKIAGIYQTTITYTGTAIDPPPLNTCFDTAPECIVFTIETDDGTYSIPTSGFVSSRATHTYDWNVYVDGQAINDTMVDTTLTTSCNNGNCIGTGHRDTAPGVNGIALVNLSSGTHQIKIVPHSKPIPGWGNAFGHDTNTAGANAATNKDKLISLDAPLTTMAFAPKTTESTTDASRMFSAIFFSCTNLTTATSLIDTYKLPSSYTNLSYFLGTTHSANRQLTSPIDLAPLSGWFASNTSITNLSNFLYNTHNSNTQLTSPIDLAPLSGWFTSNNSINDLSYFLSNKYYDDSQLTSPIDLAPLSGWFASNTSITNLSNFLYNTHYGNTQLSNPIDLTPLSGWFVANRSFVILNNFLRYTHVNNNNLILNSSNSIILPAWVKTVTEGSSNTPIWNVANAFNQTFYRGSNNSSDTSEARFDDAGNTPLSAIGEPSAVNNGAPLTANKRTYYRRTGITPLNPNWQ